MEQKSKKQSAGRGLRSDKFKRGGMATLMSVVFVAIVVVVNILVGMLTDRFPSLDVDLTAEKLNTLSDQALEVAGRVDTDTTIYLIGEEDSYRKDRIYSELGLQFSQVANLAERLSEANPKISMEFVDPDTNPAFISEYTEERLSTGKVLVKTDKRYKVLGPTDLFSVNSSNYSTYSKVDSALAGALEVVNMDKVPVLSVLTGHGEILDSSSMSSFQEQMEAQNFQVQEVNFLTEEIPEDTQLLMIPTPTKDYTEEEIQRLREYLDNDTRQEPITLLVTCYPTQGELPHLATFLEEWGVRVEQGVVVETDESRMALQNAAYAIVDPDGETLTEDYGTLVSGFSSPITLLFESSGDVGVRALWTTSDSAYVMSTEEDAQEKDPDTSTQVVATLSRTSRKVDGKNVERNVIVFGSSLAFTDAFMKAPAYGDKNYVMDLMKYATGTDGSAVTVIPETVQTNILDVSAPQSTVNFLGLGVFTIGIPVAILAAGLVIFLKRRHL